MVRSTLALAAVLSVASSSLAGDLITPSLFVGAFTNVSCELVNTSSATIPVQIQLIGSGGTVMTSTGPFPLNAGLSTQFIFSGPNDQVHCRFVGVSKSKVRADMTLSVNTDDGSDHVVVEAR
jgi:hypothetical protein